MANQEQLEILKQGVEVWNKWKKENFGVTIDLTGAELRHANLYEAHLHGADLSGVDLSGAFLVGAHLGVAKLNGANLVEANLTNAELSIAELDKANLRGAKLFVANLREANLFETDLRDADLQGANLVGAKLHGSNFSNAEVGLTIFGNSDLGVAIGLEDANWSGPSSISTDAFTLSKGRIPEAFLRGCGLSDWEIESVKLYNPDLNNDEITQIQYKIYDLRASQAIQISPLFISYSHADNLFVNRGLGQSND